MVIVLYNCGRNRYWITKCDGLTEVFQTGKDQNVSWSTSIWESALITTINISSTYHFAPVCVVNSFYKTMLGIGKEY